MQAYVGTMVCKFGGDPAVSVVEEAIFLTLEEFPRNFRVELERLGFSPTRTVRTRQSTLLIESGDTATTQQPRGMTS